MIYADANALDLHTASFTPKGSGYLGALSLNTAAIDSADTLQWLFTVSDSAIDSLNAGRTKVQLYNVAINDGHGGTVTQTITITLAGADDSAAAAPRTPRKARSNGPDNAQDLGSESNPSESGRHHDRHDGHAGPDFATLLGAHLHTSDYLLG